MLARCGSPAMEGNAMSRTRLVLGLDAATSGLCGAAMVVLASAMAEGTGLPASLIFGAGLVALAWAGLLGLILRRAAITRTVLSAIIAANLAWVAASVASVPLGLVAPTGLGVGVLLGQAAVVALFAALQAAALSASPQASP